MTLLVSEKYNLDKCAPSVVAESLYETKENEVKETSVWHPENNSTSCFQDARHLLL